MLSKFPRKRYLLELWNEGSVTPGNCHQNSPTTRIKYRLNEAYEHGSGCYPNYFKACLFWSVTLYCHETLKPAWRQKKTAFRNRELPRGLRKTGPKLPRFKWTSNIETFLLTCLSNIIGSSFRSRLCGGLWGYFFWTTFCRRAWSWWSDRDFFR